MIMHESKLEKPNNTESVAMTAVVGRKQPTADNSCRSSYNKSMLKIKSNFMHRHRSREIKIFKTTKR